VKNTTPHWIAIAVLLGVMIGFGVKFTLLGSTSTTKDDRTSVLLEENERRLVLREMRGLLEATQQIIEGLSNGNMQQVRQAAAGVGMQATSTMDITLKAKLPMAFKKMGFATHAAFDEIAAMAENHQDPKAIHTKLADTLNNCVACHASYQIPSTLTQGGHL